MIWLEQLKIDFDIVVVASSTASHVNVLKLLPKINKLLYIEKPLAHNFLKVAHRSLGNLKGRSVKLKWLLATCCVSTLQWQAVKQLIENNELGKILKYRAECGMFLPNWHPWEDYRDFYMSDIDGGRRGSFGYKSRN